MSIKTVEELRDFIAADLERVSMGDISPAVANASANLSGKMLQTVKMELEYNRMLNATPDIPFLGKVNKKFKSYSVKPNKERAVHELTVKADK